jgi:hypothetical protein
MTPDRVAAVQLDGRVTMDMQQCYVEVRVKTCCMHLGQKRVASLPCAAVHVCEHCCRCDLDGGLPGPVRHLLVRNPRLQGGLNCAVLTASEGSHVMCKDSLLVAWGGGTDRYNDSCPVTWTCCEGTQLELDR